MKVFKWSLIRAIATTLKVAAFGICTVGAVIWFKLAMLDG